MPLIVENMSLGQLRHERTRLTRLWWEYGDKVQEKGLKPRIWTSGKRFKVQATHRRIFLQLLAIGEMLEMVSQELDNRNYDHASKIRVVNFRPEA